MSIRKTVENFGSNLAPGAITIRDGLVYFRNEKLQGLDVDRILSFASNGLPVQGMISFLENKLANPSRRSIESLYWFLENGNMPITPRGTFLAYKGVTAEFWSVMTGHEPLISGTRNSNGSILNTVGQTVHMERRYVTDDFNVGCGPGLHAGSLNYARGWGARVVIVEINPADVVSVPSSEHEKLRCNKYTVIGEYVAPLTDTYTEEYHPEMAQPKRVDSETQALIDEAYRKGKEDALNEENDCWTDDEFEDNSDNSEEFDDESEDKTDRQPIDNDDVKGTTEYLDGFRDGEKDGRGHKRKNYSEGDGSNSNYILGYLDGYREARY